MFDWVFIWVFRGWPKYALDYVKANGIDTDDDYPYYAEKDSCDTSAAKVGVVNATYNIPTRGKNIKYLSKYTRIYLQISRKRNLVKVSFFIKLHL